MKNIQIYHRSSHHSQLSGYDQLIKYSGALSVTAIPRLLPYSFAKFLSRNKNQEAGLYDTNSVYKEVNLLVSAIKYFGQKKTIHYLNAERDIRLATYFSSFIKRTIVCATFHKPPSILETQILDTKHLKRLDAAIVVGKNQISFVKEHYGIDRVNYIPHGVDVNFFKPISEKSSRNTVLFVGQHLRDFDTFNAVIKAIEELNKSISIQVVLREDFKHKIIPSDIITVFSNISDAQLLDLYQNATVLYLPLLDSTACNSILEAMACGIPIITTAIGGNIEYLKNTKSILLGPKAVNESVSEIIEVINNKPLQTSMGFSVRQKAINNYDWSIVTKTVLDFYETLHNKN